MCSDSEKNMSAYADQNHAPSLTYVRLEHSDLCYYMRFLSVRQEKSIPLNQQFIFTEVKKSFHFASCFCAKISKMTFAKPALIQIFHFEFPFNFTPLIFFCNVLTFVV